MDAGTLNHQLLDAAAELRASMADLEQRSRDYAKTERTYRLARSTAYLAAHGGTVAEREAHADQATADLRYERDMAEGLKVSALEAVRSNRTILSAIQTLAGLYKAEAEFDRTGPDWGRPA